MKIERYIPGDSLRPFVKHYLIIDSESGMESRILPDSSIVMAFRCKGRVSYEEGGITNPLPVSVITGLRKSIRLLDYSKKTATLLVAFHEGGAAAFFKEPLHELFGLHLGLDHLIRCSRLVEIEERLAEATNNLQQISMVEQFLCSILKNPQLDPLILKAVQAIKSSHGDIRIKDLVTELPVSLDTFEKRFKRIIGASPKQFLTIVRLRSLIERYPQAKSLTDAAVMAGYFDQAHFIKASKSFTGQTPTAFFNASPYW